MTADAAVPNDCTGIYAPGIPVGGSGTGGQGPAGSGGFIGVGG
ncbi:MAG TPA: hypothetical protein VHE30_07150 [Polyangiaceae bacterium]|nr:hypothetical protein [Polyangiaceae bacterium]